MPDTLAAFPGLALPLALEAVLLIAIYALADRFVGGGWPALDARLPGRSAFWAGLALAAAGFLLGGPALGLLGVLWAAYRSLPFGEANKVVAKALIRHGLILPFVLFLVLWAGADPVKAGLAFAAYTTLCVTLARRLGHEEAQGIADIKAGRITGEALNEHLKGVNGQIELARGAGFGLAAAVAFLVSF